MDRLDATVRGSVQGVGFRWFVRRVAAGLRITGWVANQPDGSVRVIAEGSREALDQLAGRLRSGPAGASVGWVDERWQSATGEFAAFEIRSGSHPGD